MFVTIQNIHILIATSPMLLNKKSLMLSLINMFIAAFLYRFHDPIGLQISFCPTIYCSEFTVKLTITTQLWMSNLKCTHWLEKYNCYPMPFKIKFNILLLYCFQAENICFHFEIHINILKYKLFTIYSFCIISKINDLNFYDPISWKQDVPRSKTICSK